MKAKNRLTHPDFTVTFPKRKALARKYQMPVMRMMTIEKPRFGSIEFTYPFLLKGSAAELVSYRSE